MFTFNLVKIKPNFLNNSTLQNVDQSVIIVEELRNSWLTSMVHYILFVYSATGYKIYRCITLIKLKSLMQLEK